MTAPAAALRSFVQAPRFLLTLGLRVDRGRLVRAITLMFGGYVAAPVAALALGRFTDAALAGRGAITALLAPLIAVLLVAQLMLSHFAHLDYFELAEMQEARLREELVDIVHRSPRIDHLDRPEFADNVSLVRESLASNTRALESVLQLSGLMLQTAVTAAILVSVDPWLAVLPLAAIPSVVLARRSQAVLERARERCAAATRLHRHIVELATRADSVKELQMFGALPLAVRRLQTAWDEVTREVSRGQTAAAALRATGQMIFAVGYGGAIALVLGPAVRGQASLGDLVLVITLAVQVSVQIAGALGLLGLLHSAGRTVERIGALRAMAPPAAVSPPRASAAPRLRGIRLDRVTFSYPGNDRPVLKDVTLAIPAGSTLALVGENGAGKSTVAKLLCGLYAPTSGRILVDDVDMSTMDIEEWRGRVATLFQDFMRLELTLREGIGLGEAARLDDEEAVRDAVRAARAEGVVAVVPGGLDGYVGRSYDAGTDLSGGQWQTVGLARCLMRTHPRLLVLDEPAAALDAAAEHALFDRYAASSATSAREVDGITVLISHRFSTVLMADTIAVLDGGRLVQSGTHQELMARPGLYAELFQLQARAYH